MIFNIYTYQFKPIYQERTLFCDPDLEAKKAMEKKNTEESLIMDEGLYDEYIDSDTPRASVELHKYYDELHDAFDRYLNEVQRVEFQAACRFGYEKAICKG